MTPLITSLFDVCISDVFTKDPNVVLPVIGKEVLTLKKLTIGLHVALAVFCITTFTNSNGLGVRRSPVLPPVPVVRPRGKLRASLLVVKAIIDYATTLVADGLTYLPLPRVND